MEKVIDKIIKNYQINTDLRTLCIQTMRQEMSCAELRDIYSLYDLTESEFVDYIMGKVNEELARGEENNAATN